MVSYSPGLPQIHGGATGDLELLILLALSPSFCDYRRHLPCLVLYKACNQAQEPAQELDQLNYIAQSMVLFSCYFTTAISLSEQRSNSFPYNQSRHDENL